MLLGLMLQDICKKNEPFLSLLTNFPLKLYLLRSAGLTGVRES